MSNQERSFIFGDFYLSIIGAVKPCGRGFESKSKLTQLQVFEKLFPCWYGKTAGTSKISGYKQGKIKITEDMQREIWDLYYINDMESIDSLITSVLGDDVEPQSEIIVNTIKRFVLTWRCVCDKSKSALGEAANTIREIERVSNDVSLLLDNNDRMEKKEEINGLLIRAIAYAFVASVDFVELTPEIVLTTANEAAVETQTVFDSEAGDAIVSNVYGNADPLGSSSSLEDGIHEACYLWIEDAKKSGRLVDYYDVLERQELMDIPLTALISSNNTVDRGNGCKIEDTLFGGSDVPNTMLTAAGGAGKSFALFELASFMIKCDNFEKTHFYMPLYVPLNRLNDFAHTIFEYCENLFKQYFAKCGRSDGCEAMRIFSGELKVKPLLLLDGFNEITSTDVQNRVVGEISDLRRSYPAARFVVSSRYDFSSSFDSRGSSYFSRRELLELKDDVIIAYLIQTLGLDESSANTLWNEQSLKMKRTLRRPMALSMFVKTKKRSDLSASYPFRSCNRLAELLANYNYLLLKTTLIEDTSVDRYGSILSYIGFMMVSHLTFEVDYAQLVEWISLYCLNREGVHSDSARIDSIITILGKTVLRRQLGGIYRFSHQNLRDFNCARYLSIGLNEIICKKEGWKLCGEYFPVVFNEEILALLGEYLQDYSEGNGVINNAIRVLRDHQTDDVVYKVIVQLIQTAKIVREDLHGFDFSYLDLSGISLNGYKLYCIDEDGMRKTASFNNTIISDTTFAPQGHANAVFAMCLVENRFLLSFSQHTICYYDTENGTFATVDRFTGRKPTAAAYIGNEMVAVGDEGKNLHIMRCRVLGTGTAMRICLEHEATVTLAEIVNRILYIEKDKLIFATQDGCIYSMHSVNGKFAPELLCSLCDGDEPFKDAVCSISYTERKQKVGFHFTLEKKLYAAYGSRIYEIDPVTLKKSECYDLAKDERDQIRIFDVCAVNDGLFVYFDMADRSKVVFLVRDSNECIECGLDEAMVDHFEGYSKFNKSKSGEVFICRNDQSAEKPNAYQLLVQKNSSDSRRIEINIKALSMGVQQLRVVEGVCLPDNKLATCSVDRSVQIMDIAGSAPTVCFMGNNNGIHELFLYDDSTAFCALYSGEVSLWQRGSNEGWHCTNVYPVHTNWVWSVKTHSVGNNVYLITASYDHTIKITDAATERCVMTAVLEDQVLSVHILPTGDVVAHTRRKIHLIRVRYPISTGDCCEHLGESLLYSVEDPKFIREVCIMGQYVLAAVNNNGSCVSELLNIRIDSNRFAADTIAVLTPEPQHRIKQYVIRCLDVAGGHIAVGGDIKYNDGSRDGGFCLIIDQNKHKSDPEIHRLSERISRVNLHPSDAAPRVYAVSNSGNMITVGAPHIGDSEIKRIADTQLLDIKALDGYLYIASLDGCVYKVPISAHDEKKGSTDAEIIIESVSGFRMCGICLNDAIPSGEYSIIEQRLDRYLSDNSNDHFSLYGGY